jgi:hypothetical protein
MIRVAKCGSCRRSDMETDSKQTPRMRASDPHWKRRFSGRGVSASIPEKCAAPGEKQGDVPNIRGESRKTACDSGDKYAQIAFQASRLDR